MGITAEDRLKRGRRTDSMPSFYHEAWDRSQLRFLAPGRRFARLCRGCDSGRELTRWSDTMGPTKVRAYEQESNQRSRRRKASPALFGVPYGFMLSKIGFSNT